MRVHNSFYVYKLRLANSNDNVSLREQQTPTAPTVYEYRDNEYKGRKLWIIKKEK